jgi:prepilin peptidase CpaA
LPSIIAAIPDYRKIYRTIKISFSTMPPIVNIILLVLVLIAGVTDIKTRRIPNWLVLAGLCIGIALNSGAGLAFAVYFVFYLLRAMGAGDVKLMAAIGALAGPKSWLLIFFFTAIAGGVVALVLLIAKGRFKRTLLNVGIMLHQLSRLQAPYQATEELDVRSGKALRLPHGATIALGTMAYMAADFIQYRPWH